MNILVLHQFVNHNQLIDSLCENLNTKNLEIDSFNISTWELVSKNKNVLPVWILILKNIFFNSKLKLALLKLFPNIIINTIAKRYNIIDIHFFGPVYFKIIDLLKKKKKKIKITVWGSDFYRSPISRKEKQRKYYNKVDLIHIGIEQMRLDFLSYYNDFEEKIRITQFGILQLDIIKKLSINNTQEQLKSHLNLPLNKLIITCGYNGIKEQQHIVIFEAINLLTKQEKENIFLLIPMTNGCNEVYKKILEDKLNTIGVYYKILTTKLSTEDVCKLRLATDITINIQVSDAFSASLQEHLYSKNIVLVGDWLPYNKLDENDIFYLKTTKEGLQNNLKEIVNNFSFYKEKSKNNNNKINKVSSWEAVKKDWIKLYTEIS